MKLCVVVPGLTPLQQARLRDALRGHEVAFAGDLAADARRALVAESEVLFGNVPAAWLVVVDVIDTRNGAAWVADSGQLRMLSQRAKLDGLTALWNRAYFDQRLAAEFAEARRHGKSMSLIMCDIDHFKSVNDRFGHPFGDEVLALVTTDSEEQLRTMLTGA